MANTYAIQFRVLFATNKVNDNTKYFKKLSKYNGLEFINEIFMEDMQNRIEYIVSPKDTIFTPKDAIWRIKKCKLLGDSYYLDYVFTSDYKLDEPITYTHHLTKQVITLDAFADLIKERIEYALDALCDTVYEGANNGWVWHNSKNCETALTKIMENPNIILVE